MKNLVTTILFTLISVFSFGTLMGQAKKPAVVDSLSYELEFPFEYTGSFEIKVHTDEKSVAYYVRQANFVENPVPLDVMRHIDGYFKGKSLGEGFENKIVTFIIQVPSRFNKLE